MSLPYTCCESSFLGKSPLRCHKEGAFLKAIKFHSRLQIRNSKGTINLNGYINGKYTIILKSVYFHLLFGNVARRVTISG